MNSVKIEVTQ